MLVPATLGKLQTTEVASLVTWEGGLVTSFSSGLLDPTYLVALQHVSQCMVIYLSGCLFLLLLECVILWGRDQSLDIVSSLSLMSAEI